MAGRSAGQSPEECARLDDLMDAVHNLPHLITRWDTVNEKLLRDMLADYDAKWAAQSRIGLLAVYERELAGGAG